MKKSIIALVAAILVAAVATGANASGPGWSVSPTPNPSAPTGQLSSVSCFVVSSCTAVGSYVRRSGIGATLAERWDGSVWGVEPTPDAPAARVSSLNGVACPTIMVCIAVGDSVSASGVTATLAEHWDGTIWTIESTPNPSGARGAVLFGIACFSASSCIAVGSSDGAALAERWDGVTWTIDPAVVPSGAQFSELNAVACTSSSSCIATGDYVDATGTDMSLAETLSGTQWQTRPTPNPSGAQVSFLSGVACSSPSACTAVGGSSDGSGTFGTLVEGWNGSAWGIAPSPSPSGSPFSTLFSVSCTASTACTGVGGYTDGSGTFVTLAERWDGTQWLIQATPPGKQNSYLGSVACTSATACVAVGGSHGSGTPRALAEGWDGSTWSVQEIPSPSGAAESQLNGVACSGSSICEAVGVGGNATLAERWNGTSWRIQRTPTRPGGALNADSCTSRSMCIAVGGSYSGPLAERWDGTSWKMQRTPSPPGVQGSSLLGISCASPSSCMATGASFDSSGGAFALAERWDGRRWKIVPTPEPTKAVQTFLGAVSCTSSSACTSVGEQHSPSGIVHTIAERWDGKTWEIQPTPNPRGVQFASLGGVACSGPSSCIATGGSDRGALAERWNGTSWKILRVPNPTGGFGSSLNGVSCTSASACTSVGFSSNDLGGIILAERWNGTAWRIQQTPLLPAAHDHALPGIACPEPFACTAVGGFENDGPDSVTLAERWTGSTASASWAGPDTPASVRPAGISCLRGALFGAPAGRGPAAFRSFTRSGGTDPSTDLLCLRTNIAQPEESMWGRLAVRTRDR